jgi:RNA polymerase sigma-70 factor, ECF subfamily
VKRRLPDTRRASATSTPGASLAAAAEQPAGAVASTGRDAAEELFNACYPRLTGWVRRLVGTDEDAHDIAAEAFARLLGRRSRVDNPHSYLYVIAANLISDHWRKAGREQRAIKNLATAAATASCRQGQEADLRALIEALPPRLRAAFLLHHYAGFEVRQIAAMTGRPEGTIKADLYRSRASAPGFCRSAVQFKLGLWIRLLLGRRWPGCPCNCPRPGGPGRAVSYRSWCPT